MKTILAILFSTSLLFSENEEISFAEAPTFTSPSLPELQGAQLTPLLPKAYKSPFLAVGLSFIFPGLGHTYLQDYKTAGTLGASTATLLTTSKLTSDAASTISIVQGWSYGIYAAYRDVRLNNGQIGYSYKMPMDTFSDLARASFNWSVLKKPEVWGGYLGALTLGTTVGYFSMKSTKERIKNREIDLAAPNLSNSIFPLAAFSVGVGEEAFFRGFLQSAFAENLSPTGAIIASSIAFGAAHINRVTTFNSSTGRFSFNKGWEQYLTYSIPYITVFGGYMGWLTHKNKSLKSSVALHSWYDFTLFSIISLAGPSAATGNPHFNLSFDF